MWGKDYQGLLCVLLAPCIVDAYGQTIRGGGGNAEGARVLNEELASSGYACRVEF